MNEVNSSFKNKLHTILMALILMSFIFGCSHSNENKHAPKTIMPNHIYHEGNYDSHLQGFCFGNNSIFYSFGNTIVKSSKNGKLLKEKYIQGHHGDLAHYGNRVYVTYAREYNIGINAGSKVLIFDENLNLIKEISVPEVVYGAGAIAIINERIYISGGLKSNEPENIVYIYDMDLNYIQTKKLAAYTKYGIQNIAHNINSGNIYFVSKFEEIVTDYSLSIISIKKTKFRVGGIDFIGEKKYYSRNFEDLGKNSKSLTPESHYASTFSNTYFDENTLK